MIKSRKQMYLVIGAFALVLMLFTTTFAFFNYTRTEASNVIKVGRIFFESKNEENVVFNPRFKSKPLPIKNDIVISYPLIYSYPKYFCIKLSNRSCVLSRPLFHLCKLFNCHSIFRNTLLIHWEYDFSLFFGIPLLESESISKAINIECDMISSVCF